MKKKYLSLERREGYRWVESSVSAYKLDHSSSSSGVICSLAFLPRFSILRFCYFFYFACHRVLKFSFEVILADIRLRE